MHRQKSGNKATNPLPVKLFFFFYNSFTPSKPQNDIAFSGLASAPKPSLYKFNPDPSIPRRQGKPCCRTLEIRPSQPDTKNYPSRSAPFPTREHSQGLARFPPDSSADSLDSNNATRLPPKAGSGSTEEPSPHIFDFSHTGRRRRSQFSSPSTLCDVAVVDRWCPSVATGPLATFSRRRREAATGGRSQREEPTGNHAANRGCECKVRGRQTSCPVGEKGLLGYVCHQLTRS